jgi:uroporphyrinogen decarboxylase
LIEGRPSRDFTKVKAFMYSEPRAFDLLLEKLATTMSGYLAAQVAAGASAVQLFDSWVGALALEDYETRVVQHTRAIFDALAPLDVPRIHFGTNTATLLEAIARSGPDIVSLDWRIPLDDGWRRVGPRRGVQGNLDPAVLLGPAELVRERTRDVLRRAGGRAGHIFNLGHGVLPETPLGNLQLLVETVRAWVPADVA